MRRTIDREECFVVYYENKPWGGPYCRIGQAKAMIARYSKYNGYNANDFRVVKYVPVDHETRFEL